MLDAPTSFVAQTTGYLIDRSLLPPGGYPFPCAASLDLYQFSGNFRFWASSEVESGEAPGIPLEAGAGRGDAEPVFLRSRVSGHRFAASGLAPKS